MAESVESSPIWCDHPLGHYGECISTDHQQLLRQIMCNMEASSRKPCLICAIKELQEDRAERCYGPNFDVDQYRFELHQWELEGMIAETSINAIPDSYIRLMRKVCDASVPKPKTSLEKAQRYKISIPLCSERPALKIQKDMVHPSMTTQPQGVNVREIEEWDGHEVPPTPGWGHVYERMATGLGQHLYEVDKDEHAENWDSDDSVW